MSKLLEMINLIGFTSEAIIALNCAQSIRDFLDDSWVRRSLLLKSGSTSTLTLQCENGYDLETFVSCQEGCSTKHLVCFSPSENRVFPISVGLGVE